MEDKEQLSAKILTLTLCINEKFPELSKYLEEMPISIPDVAHPVINEKTLQDYYNSLILLLKQYSSSHSDKDGQLSKNGEWNACFPKP